MQTTELTDGKPAGGSPALARDVGSLVALPSLVPLFALIIGIDDYSDCQKLRGAVADAKAMQDFLEEVLWVPQEHIHTLFNTEATRDAIIKAFRDLRDDQRISNGDPILIYYSGHGGELPAPDAWDIKGRIQCLLPCDYNKRANIHPIPDRTIGALIEDIAKQKGDNITVIFDCCHSASGTRIENKEYVPRTVVLDHNIHGDLDHDIWESRAGQIAPDLAYYGLRSHVLLAACEEKELAYEHEGRGQFTTALLSALKNNAVGTLSYTDLLKRIHITKQHPRCEGVHQHRILFNAKVSADRQVRHSVRAVQGCKYVISAGLAHGVSYGVELILYSDQKQRESAIVVDDTALIEDFQTTVTTSIHLANDVFARLTRVGKLPFYLAPAGTSSLEAHQRMTGNSTRVANFQLVENVEEAKLEVVVEGQRATFNILDRRVREFGLTRLPHAVRLVNVAHVLNAAAHYYWYLDLKNKNNHIATKDLVSINFYSLLRDFDDDGCPHFIPVEPGYCRKDQNWDGLDVIEFVVSPRELYGIKITNNTPWDLYLNAFLFNNSSLSIEPYYTQQGHGNQDPPLKQNGTFTIGYGPGGISAFAYSLEEGQDVDVGYLKIFFATRPIDLSGLARKTSAFTDMEKRDLEDDTARKAKLSVSQPTKAPSEPVDTWFTIEIPVVQRRKKVAV